MNFNLSFSIHGNASLAKINKKSFMAQSFNFFALYSDLKSFFEDNRIALSGGQCINLPFAKILKKTLGAF